MRMGSNVVPGLLDEKHPARVHLDDVFLDWK